MILKSYKLYENQNIDKALYVNICDTFDSIQSTTWKGELILCDKF